MTTLAQRLREIRHSFETGPTSPEVVEVLNAHVDRLVASKTEGQALAVGDSAPLHHVVETDDGCKSLQELCGTRFLVLTWFRGNW
jgi:hypothetical protein